MTNEKAYSVTVIGAGSWGTALAILLAQDNKPVVLWGHNKNHLTGIATQRCNQKYLPDITLPDSLSINTDLEQAVNASNVILISVPSHAFRDTLKKIAPFLKPQHSIAWASKGLEPETHKLLHTIVIEELGVERECAAVSGPTFAGEVAKGLPTAITVASSHDDFAASFATRLHSKTFRAYTTHDVIGVEVGGAVKNALAIAAGIADGLGFGANTRAALITRGLAEMSRLGLTLGAEPETFMGLAGLGDLVLTCTDDQSRNRRFGKLLAAGKTPEHAFTEIGQVVEGAQTAMVLHGLAEKLSIDMPICEQVYRVIYEQHDPHEAVSELFNRKQKPE